ncbi:MFS transporter [Candidatus Amarolinea aalborgensis]|jgi:MFS family permease|uniref:MFS transporter n=1 Tax=Candidatus Amarolinea aalborgensis TaxID=2249329 RepID=UPI003BFA2FC8
MARSRIDVGLLFATRITRLFAYGALSVVLALYLAAIGLDEGRIGLLFTLTLAGDAAVTLAITTTADRLGRRRSLMLGAALMALAGAAFLLTRQPTLLLLAAIIGVISPSGNEIGPFLAVEQAGLAQILPGARRTQVFAWYNLVGSLATAAGALGGGLLVQALQSGGHSAVNAYQAVLLGYALCGLLLIAWFFNLSPAVESPSMAEIVPVSRRFGLHRSGPIVLQLSALFALDAFAGGFVIQSIVAYWFYTRFGLSPAALGAIFFAANILAGVSALLAARLAARFGLINTMVMTHLPSNVLLCLVPLMPTLPLSIAVLLLRFSISQMDVPARQSYTMAVVSPDERSAASGVTAIARSVGASISPWLSGLLLAGGYFAAPFLLAGGLKIAYDLLLYRSFRTFKPPEEAAFDRPAEPPH